ncbi:MAG: restriction endonuclease subunit S [Flavobacteriales bacterium]|nr:restriction endonuclease subunit S [Flavobacteriales bacterium]
MIKVEVQEITNNLDRIRVPLNSMERAEKETNPIYPYIGANNIMGYIDEYLFDEKILCVAEDGGSWGYQQTCAKIYNEKVWVNNHAHVLTAKDNLILEYLMYYLNYADLTLYINGATRGKLTKSSLNGIKIPLPPLDQQKKIAAILDTADAYRQKTKALIDKYDELTQSLFLDMFGDPFKGDVSPLKNNISIVGGYAFKSKDFVKEGLPLIKIGTVNKGYFEIDNFSFLPKSYLSKYLKWNVKSGDILMSLTGTVGKDDYGNVEKATDHYENYLLNQRVAKLEPSNDVYLKDFLFGMFSNNKTKKELTKISRGVRQANISNRDIENLKMITPSIEDQKLYILAVASIEAQKAQTQASLAQAEDLFNSLLQRAFKGELV